MRRWTLYVERAAELLSNFEGGTPLAPVLKAYFKENKQMGATDRRYVSDLVYSYYRLGHTLRDMPIGDRIMIAYFLTRQTSSPLLEMLRPEWVDLVGLDKEEKAKTAGVADLGGVFPWGARVSAGVNLKALTLSHLQQPDVFIRIRPGHEAEVREGLGGAGMPFAEVEVAGSGHCLRLPSGSSIQDLLQVDKAYVVQDLSSQRVGGLMQRAFDELGTPDPQVWDCCAASGGKAILLKDILPSARLTVSDIRAAILHNLDRRFEAAALRFERAFAADLSGNGPPVPGNSFDLIVADVPCSGSGTWSRTPEQLYFFREEMIAEYARLQKNILKSVNHSLRPGGLLLYVTCSVFADENESNVQFLENVGLKKIEQVIFEGYENKADTLFASLLRKPNYDRP